MIGILSEPPARRGFAGLGWLTSSSGLAAIVWQGSVWPRGCALVRQGRDFVAARAGQWIIVSCYVSPQVNRAYYLRFLDELGDLIGDNASYSMIVGGDFNARSPAWNPGASNNYKGTLLKEWAAERPETRE